MKPSSSRTRTLALIRKETRQMLRDRSTLILGIVLPFVLLLLFGFGLSFDLVLLPVALVRDGSSPVTMHLHTSLRLSPYFAPSLVNSMRDAEKALREGAADAIVRRDLHDRADGSESIQIIVNGRDANRARIMQRYLEGAVSLWAARRTRGQAPVGMAAAEPRIWYNHAMESRYFLVPGVTALIMSLIGALLTAMVMAREWERGTYEALISTPARAHEIILGKITPYFLLGMIALGLCLAAGAWVFQAPMRGSLLLIVGGSAVYLLVGLGIGLLVSASVKSQFLSSQIVLMLAFFPTVMLSGFIFDLNGAPLFIRCVAHVFPATWYVELLQTLFLAGDIPSIVLRNMAVLAGFACVLLGLARKATRKSLE
ncbi:MAG: ABC transporter permease [Deltaproteobacteria bacterium]|jgi:ABC-2 type transport system permease protein|nr:ABC transporter permease [Deltaproteobacteria bacterium]